MFGRLSSRFLFLLFFLLLSSSFCVKAATSKRVWIFGEAGGGKSTFTNYMLEHNFSLDASNEVIVSNISKPHAKMSADSWEDCTIIPEVFTLKEQEEKISFIDLPTLRSKKEQKTLTQFLELEFGKKTS